MLRSGSGSLFLMGAGGLSGEPLPAGGRDVKMYARTNYPARAQFRDSS